MKKRVLLIDESLTVQKVVALTLDRARFAISYARSRSEAMKMVVDSQPDLILVSDQVTDITIPSFPKEVEAWLGRGGSLPPILLITGQDIREFRHYAGVLKKPFSPQVLQSLIDRHTQPPEQSLAPVSEGSYSSSDEYEDQRLQKIFNEAFADESKLVTETFRAEHEQEERTLLNVPVPPPSGTSRPAVQELWEEQRPARVATAPRVPAAPRTQTPNDLWNVTPPAAAPRPKQAPADVLGADDSMAYKAVLESQVEEKLESQNLEEVVNRCLAKLLPPIVERLVQERLDKLLKEQEQFMELKS